MAVLPRFAKWSNRRNDSCAVIDAFDVGTGGGFYVDATEPRWSAAPAKRYPTLHQRRSSNTSHGEGVATYHGSRRQNGDHWAVTSVFIGMAPPVAGIGAPQVMVPPSTTAVELIQGPVEFVQTVDDGEACCERTVAPVCRTKVSSRRPRCRSWRRYAFESRPRGPSVVRDVPRDSRHTDAGGRSDPVVVSRSQGARLRDRTANRHPHSVPHPWLHSGVLVKTQCARFVFSPTCVSTWPACWSSKCNVPLLWLTHLTPAATSTISSCEYKGVMDVLKMVCLADLSNDLGLPGPVVASFSPVLEFITPAHAGHLPCREIHLASSCKISGREHRNIASHIMSGTGFSWLRRTSVSGGVHCASVSRVSRARFNHVRNDSANGEVHRDTGSFSRDRGVGGGCRIRRACAIPTLVVAAAVVYTAITPGRASVCGGASFDVCRVRDASTSRVRSASVSGGVALSVPASL